MTARADRMLPSAIPTRGAACNCGGRYGPHHLSTAGRTPRQTATPSCTRQRSNERQNQCIWCHSRLGWLYYATGSDVIFNQLPALRLQHIGNIVYALVARVRALRLLTDVLNLSNRDPHSRDWRSGAVSQPKIGAPSIREIRHGTVSEQSGSERD